MRHRVSIRTRFALMSAALAVGVLGAGMFTVYQIERRQVSQNLQADARTAAVNLSTAGERDSAADNGASEGSAQPGDDSGESGSGAAPPASERYDDVVRAYLGARGGSNELLASIADDGSLLANTARARRLAGMQLPPPGGRATVSLDGEPYQVAVVRRGHHRVVAAVPAAEADAAVHRLVMAMLIVCAVALIPATLAAWLAARRALHPLSQIAHRATRVTGGDLSVRMGPVATHDEIAEVAVAIDAMLDRLQTAFDSQRRFVHDASHELRTPLTIARGHLEVALPADADPEVRAAVEVALGEIDRMSRLVDSLLRLAREDQGDAVMTPVDVGDLAGAVIERSRVLGEREWLVRAEEGALVDGDADALEQVILNLVANAVRHTAPGDPIEVTVDHDAASVVIEVADGGEGIDPELLPHLFDRFVRADNARGRDTGGAGLGLSICRSIVEEHGGRIRAENGDRTGARFVIELPGQPRAPDETSLIRVSRLAQRTSIPWWMGQQSPALKSHTTQGATVNRQPYVAGAAIVAGLIVGGGAYTARHGIGQPPVDSAAASRTSIVGHIPRVPHVRLAEWHPPKIPKVTVRVVAPAVTSAPAPVAAVSSPAPVTRTSPVASGDDGEEAGDD